MGLKFQATELPLRQTLSMNHRFQEHPVKMSPQISHERKVLLASADVIYQGKGKYGVGREDCFRFDTVSLASKPGSYF